MSASMCHVFRNVSKVKMLNKSLNMCVCRFLSTSSATRGYQRPIKSKPGKNGTKLFRDIIEENRQIAARSILVTHMNPKQLPFTRVTKKLMFKCENRYFTLVEFASYAAVTAALQSVQYFEHVKHVPVRSRFIFDNYSFARDKVAKEPINLAVDEEKVVSSLSESANLSDQIQQLYQKTKMSELHTRLRYFLCYSLEEMLSGLLETGKILPFGSSVNGLGKYNCDLDMIMSLGDTKQMNNQRQQTAQSRFRFMTKKRDDPDLARKKVLCDIDAYGCIIKAFLPQFFHISSRTRARVPIVNFKYESCNIFCDLSVDMDGHYMGELMWILGQVDERFRLLMFTIRAWAKAKEVTGEPLMNKLSNYMLSLMLVHFLQSRPQPVLPAVQQLIDLADTYNNKTYDEDRSVHFVSDYTKVPKSENQETTTELLKGFFTYYGDLELNDQGICIVSGRLIKKDSDHEDADLYLVNPIDKTQNAARIVKKPELHYFQSSCRAAFTDLDNTVGQAGKRLDTSDDWGLVKLLEPVPTQMNKPAEDATLQSENTILQPITTGHVEKVNIVDITNVPNESNTETSQSKVTTKVVDL